MSEVINKNRYKNRRRMAWLSFGCIFAFGAGLLFFGLSDDDRAQRVEDLSFLIGSLLGVWTTVVAAYYGVTAVTDNTEIRVAGNTYDRTIVTKAPFIPDAPVTPGDPYA